MITDPNEPPVEAFDRYLAEVEPTLPERYRNPGARPLHPFRSGPAIGLAIVVLGIAGYAVAKAFGWLP